MRVLYGVQGTGNGHLSRARAMADAFRGTRLELQYLFSGRDPAMFFDMQCFGEYQTRRGLTFANSNGQIDYWQTFRINHYGRFLRDVTSLDLAPFDLVITDFEPVSAWAGLLRRKAVISMGHQPAFDHRIPIARRNLLSTMIMRVFAPGQIRVGMHWDKFDAPILPPLIDVVAAGHTPQKNKVLVYLPFESQTRVHGLLAQLSAYQFYIYAPNSETVCLGNLHLRSTSVEGFRADLQDCSAVLCNAGFELASECLALGKRLLVKPQGGQMEQASNALALQSLGYAAVLDELDAGQIGNWLDGGSDAARMEGPDIARAIAEWLEDGDYRPESLERLSDQLWRKVRVNAKPVWPRT